MILPGGSRRSFKENRPFLFNNSLRFNIAYGLTDVSDAEIVAATKRANAIRPYNNIIEMHPTDYCLLFTVH